MAHLRSTRSDSGAKHIDVALQQQQQQQQQRQQGPLQFLQQLWQQLMPSDGTFERHKKLVRNKAHWCDAGAAAAAAAVVAVLHGTLTSER
jgi:type VI protein secretion system component VasK